MFKAIKHIKFEKKEYNLCQESVSIRKKINLKNEETQIVELLDVAIKLLSKNAFSPSTAYKNLIS